MCQRNAKKRRQKEVKSPNEVPGKGVAAWTQGDVLRPHSALPVSRWNHVSLPDSFDVHVPSHETAVTLDKLLGLSVVASR